jgi:hypothetical protein
VGRLACRQEAVASNLWVKGALNPDWIQAAGRGADLPGAAM